MLKSKVVKAKMSKAVANPDTLGTRYEQISSEEKALADSKAAIKNSIFALAEAEGKVHLKNTTVKGDTFEVGFLTTDPSVYVDAELVRIHIPKAFHKKIFKSVEVLDEQALHNLFTLEELDAKLIDKIQLPKGEGQRRIVVKRL